MRTCAICSKRISRRDICNSCFREWGNGGSYPSWLGAMIKLHHHFETTKANFEVTFTEDGRDMQGEKFVKMQTNLP